MARRLGESAWGDFFRLCVAVPRAMKVTLINLFRRPVTVHYPDRTRNYPDRYRGLLALTYDKETGEENCIGCRLCEYICPPQVIKVEMLKAMFIFLVVTWIRWSFVRIRADQIMRVSWKLMLPATLILLLATAVVVVLRTPHA